MPGRRAMGPEPLRDDQRAAVVARLAAHAAEAESMALDTARWFYYSGTPAAVLADALGMGERTFFRRLADSKDRLGLVPDPEN